MHSAFAGFTNFTSGVINNHPVIIPVDFISSLGMRTIDTEIDMDYLSMLASTGQPSFKDINLNLNTNNSTNITSTLNN